MWVIIGKADKEVDLQGSIPILVGGFCIPLCRAVIAKRVGGVGNLDVVDIGALSFTNVDEFGKSLIDYSQRSWP